MIRSGFIQDYQSKQIRQTRHIYFNSSPDVSRSVERRAGRETMMLYLF